MMIWRKNNLPKVTQPVTGESYSVSFLPTILHTSSLFWRSEVVTWFLHFMFVFTSTLFLEAKLTLRKVKNMRQRTAWHQRESWRSSKTHGWVAAMGGGPGCWPWMSRKQPVVFPHMTSIVNLEWTLADRRSRAPNVLCSSDLDTAQERHSALSSQLCMVVFPQCSLALPFPMEGGKHTMQKSAIRFPRTSGMFST